MGYVGGERPEYDGEEKEDGEEVRLKVSAFGAFCWKATRSARLDGMLNPSRPCSLT